MNKILAIIPTYNESSNILHLLNEVLKVNSESSLDILVIDDGSPDGTANLVKEHEQFEKRIFLLERPKKLGLGSAYCTGFKWAIKKEYEKIIQIDADFSHNPKYIKDLLSYSNDYELVIGSRYISGVNVVNWPMSRLLLSYFANVYAKLITGVPISDLTGGFKCFNVNVLDKINFDKIKSEGYSFQIEMNFIVNHLGCKIKEIPIIFNDRTKGSSKMSKKVIFEAIYMVPLLKIKKILRLL